MYLFVFLKDDIQHLPCGSQSICIIRLRSYQAIVHGGTVLLWLCSIRPSSPSCLLHSTLWCCCMRLKHPPHNDPLCLATTPLVKQCSRHAILCKKEW